MPSRITWPRTYICQNELLRRGWTGALIAGLLGPPDRHAANPCCRRWADARLWLRDRVEAVEREAAWREYRMHLDIRLRRLDSSAYAAEYKRQSNGW